MSQKKLKILNAKKESLLGRAQRLIEWGSQFPDAKAIKNFQLGIGALESTRDAYAEIVEEINTIELDENPDYAPSFEDTEKFHMLYCQLKNMELELKEKTKPTEKTTNVKLPKLELPKFDGDLRTWPIFKESFERTIHNNNSIDEDQKVQYLIGRLTGKALQMIASIPPTSKNYNLIWKKITDKYEDLNQLARFHVSQMLGFKNCSYESVTSLENFLERFVTAYEALRNINLPDLTDFIILQIAYTKLDSETLKGFEMCMRTTPIPTFEQLVEFIQQQVKIIDHPKRNFQRGNYKALESKHQAFVVNKNTCRICKCCNIENHNLYSCSKFLAFTVKQRFEFVKNNNRCFNCLGEFHSIYTCKSLKLCNICHKKHHSLLHFEEPIYESNDKAQESLAGTTLSVMRNAINEGMTLLSTTALTLHAGKKSVLVRALLDSASQCNLITEKCQKMLGLPLLECSSSLLGVGGRSSKILGKTIISFSPHFTDKKVWSLEALVIDNICSELPSMAVNVSLKKYLLNIQLADPKFDVPGEIEVLIGAELFPTLIKNRSFVVPNTMCHARETSLGWILMGKVPISETILNDVKQSFCIQQESIEQLMRKFWEVEDFSGNSEPNATSNKCEELFQQGVTRDTEGRYIVSLPFLEEPSVLGDSLDGAKKRFFNLERKFEQLPDFRKAYCKVITEFLDKGYLHEIPNMNEAHTGYFVPHHGVWRKESSSTPLRVVFDASAKTSSGKSLNDILHTGPKLQTNPILILLNFRLFPVGITCDIKKMYMQISLCKEHHKFQRILWRFDNRSPLKILELCRVGFGLRSSPYLAQRVILQLVQDEIKQFPHAQQHIPNSMYVDDIIFSEKDVQTGSEVCSELTNFFKRGQFELGKWTTNCVTLPQNLKDEIECTNAFDFSFEATSKVLGLRWDPKVDELFFKFEFKHIAATKRNILSTIARMFDPLGLIGPIMLHAKILVKSLWKEKLDWDELPSEEITERWNTFINDLEFISNVRIPRHVNVFENSTIDLVGFCDGSELGYGAVVYLRTSASDFSSSTSIILCAKSRVTPMKTLSIPRIELCGALLLSELLNFVVQCYSTRVTINKIFAFSDSKIALSWISSTPDRWNTFVSNRVTKIQEGMPSASWNYIPSKDNPADVLSRGILPSKLDGHKLWWHGPSWITEDHSAWPIPQEFCVDESEIACELKKKKVTLINIIDENCVIMLANKVSSWSKFLRILCYILRFTGVINPAEKVINAQNLNLAEHYLLKLIQSLYYKKELIQLNKGLPCQSSLRKLCLFVQDGLIRVGGRLTNADIGYESKHPILLPRECPVVNLIINYYHKLYLHPGTNLLISLLRQKYWIVKVRPLVKQVTSRCWNCFRVNPRPAIPMMADLPKHRVTPSPPFCHVGVDYAGPFNLTFKRGRGQRSHKHYLCLFVCMATKAVHLEIAHDLSTSAFINAFQRFIARRGLCKVIYSDRGTNFIGAKAIVHEMYKFVNSKHFQESLENFANDKRIDWRFNPPNSPHFGGLWESLIKEVKRHLHRSIGSQVLTVDEFNTLIVQIEAVLNSRPLTTLGEDPSDLVPLTPNHFLTVKPLTGLANFDYVRNRNVSRPQLLQNILGSFWRRWSKEYLHQLQTRQKWNSPSSPVTIGQPVLLVEDTPPLNWPLGVITKTFPGKDGVTRVAEIKTKRGTYVRPVIKLCPLPND